VELHQLRYFVAVAEQRHFTRAAAGLHVAQPSVSSQIRKLEVELGAPLFHRARDGVALTQAGEVMLPLARRILVDVEEAATQVRELGALRHGRLSVGATPSISTVLLPAVLGSFHRAHPGVVIVLAEEGSRDLVAKMRSGEIELGLLILPVDDDGLATTPVAEEELVVAVGPSHRLAGRGEVAVGDLRDVPLVMFRDGYDLRSATVAACRQAGFEPQLAAEGGEMDGVLALVGAGVGAAVVPSIVASSRPELHIVRFDPPVLRRTIGLARRDDRALSRAADAFLDELRQLLGGQGWPGEVPTGLRLL
jgi:DNA-binding transcriptional LysR family regulator